METMLGWDTAGGVGMLLAGLGVFFWGLQVLRSEHWRRRRWANRDEDAA